MSNKRWSSEIKLSMAEHRQWPVHFYTDISLSAATGIEGTFWLLSVWSQMSLHRCITQKCVMDPWAALYQKSNDQWCLTYDQKRSGRNFLQTSVISTVSTQCYTKEPYKEDALQTNLRCCFHCPAMLHPFLHGESVSPMMHFHTCYQPVTHPHITTYYNMSLRLGSLPKIVTPVGSPFTKKGSFCKLFC
jgi:hypothetical protein